MTEVAACPQSGKKNIRVVVAPDSFKGSLSAEEAAACCREAVMEVVPDAEVVTVPLADGGEGTVDVLAVSSGGRKKRCQVENPVGRLTTATYLVSPDGKSAIMEIAQSSGLTLLGMDERNPMDTSTYGAGTMIADAVAAGCRKVMVGLGGSATNDGGMGMLTALGYRFHDKDGRILKGCGKDLGEVVSVDMSSVDPLLRDVRFTVACDVDNPFVGPRGAAAVFAPQKGADPAMVSQLEEGMERFAHVVEEATGVAVASLPGAGAAGGLGGAFVSFLGAEMVAGVDMVLDALHFDRTIEGADLVITGEGKIDSQSLMGKVLSGVLSRSRAAGVPVLAVGGCVEMCQELRDAGFVGVAAATPEGMSHDIAMRPDVAVANIRQAVKGFLRQWLAERTL